MKDLWNDNRQGKTEVLGRKSCSVSLCPQQISHKMTWDRTRAFEDNRPATNRQSQRTAIEDST